MMNVIGLVGRAPHLPLTADGPAEHLRDPQVIRYLPDGFHDERVLGKAAAAKRNEQNGQWAEIDGQWAGRAGLAGWAGLGLGLAERSSGWLAGAGRLAG